MACLECVRACSNAFYKEFHPGKSCIQIVELKGKAKPMVCVQCGKCAAACEAGAITQNAKGVYVINKKLCVGCGKCVEACPFKVMVKVESSPVASKCIACGIAQKHVPWKSWKLLRSKSIHKKLCCRRKCSRVFLKAYVSFFRGSRNILRKILILWTKSCEMSKNFEKKSRFYHKNC